MRIIVCVKQGLDPQSVKISRSREELDLREACMRTQPEDKYALEAGLRLEEAAQAAEVIAVVVGEPDRRRHGARGRRDGRGQGRPRPPEGPAHGQGCDRTRAGRRRTGWAAPT